MKAIISALSCVVGLELALLRLPTPLTQDVLPGARSRAF